MKSLPNFFRILFNCVGLSCFVIEDDTLKVSKAIAAKNFLTLLLIIAVEISFSHFIDLTIFLPDGQSTESFTKFSLAMFRLIGILPLLAAAFIITNQNLKRKQVLSLLNDIKNFDESFTNFSEAQNFIKTIRLQSIVMLAYLTSLKVLQIAVMLKVHLIVLISYFSKFYCDYVTLIFLIVFSLFIKYFTFVIKDINRCLKIALELELIVEVETILNYYDRISKILSTFYNIFHLQVCVLVSFIIAKLLFLVSKMQCNFLIEQRSFPQLGKFNCRQKISSYVII